MGPEFDHEKLDVYPKALENVREGKSSLANIVRMLVVWERNLEQRD